MQHLARNHVTEQGVHGLVLLKEFTFKNKSVTNGVSLKVGYIELVHLSGGDAYSFNCELDLIVWLFPCLPLTASESQHERLPIMCKTICSELTGQCSVA